MKTVRIPADIDQEDRLLGGLTARQLVLVVVPIIALWSLYLATRTLVPLLVFVPLTVIVMGTVGTVVVTKRDGLSMDRFLFAAFRHRHSQRQLVLLPPDAPASDLAPIRLPVNDVREDGVVDLGADGMAVLCRAESVNLALHSDVEQEALTAGFGRFCNALQGSVQFIVRSERIELTDAVQRLRSEAQSLPSVGLERAARDHAAFLEHLATRHDVLRRQTFVVFRSAGNNAESAASLLRKAQEAALSMRSAGVELRVLNHAAAIRAIQSSSAPSGARLPLVDDITIGIPL